MTNSREWPRVMLNFLSKFVPATFAVFVIAQSAHAGVGVGLSYAGPTGDFGDIAGGGGGLHLTYEAPSNTNFAPMASVGAIAYGGIQIFGAEIQWYGYPVNVGGRLYTTEDKEGPFVEVLGGYLMKLGTVEAFGEEESESESAWNVSPGVGVKIGQHISAKINYNIGDDDWTWLGIQAGFSF